MAREHTGVTTQEVMMQEATSGAEEMLNSLGITIPTTLEEAQVLARQILEREGQPHFTKLTGLTDIPQNETEFATM